MTGARPSACAGLALLAVVAVGLAVSRWHRRGQPSASAPAAGEAAASAATATPVARAPLVELDEHGSLRKVAHQDSRGRIPLEYVQTPEGTLTIRRTFDASGRLLKEEGFRGEQRVPMPAAR